MYHFKEKKRTFKALKVLQFNNSAITLKDKTY